MSPALVLVAALGLGTVTYVPAANVAAAFLKGQPMVEQENYKVHASRRGGAGEVEVHTADTDIIYMQTGTATLVTGGTMVGGRETAAEELRGASIEGGETREVGPGDLIVIPQGTPHWFRVVPGPLTYYVVKVRAVEAK